jgi:hypothetical protein
MAGVGTSSARPRASRLASDIVTARWVRLFTPGRLDVYTIERNEPVEALTTIVAHVIPRRD